MPQSVNDFLKHLVTSRLMTLDAAKAFLAGLPPGEQPGDGEALARRMVRHGKLTLFQANAIFKGKPHGLVLGDYAILDRIGAGGMGQVFKAVHHRMERVVAIKVLSANMTKSPEALQRFEREVKAAAKLSHANIVTAYDARNDAGVFYLVMEYVDGNDLAKIVRDQGPLPVPAAIDYVVQTARGLEHAHGQGIVHRDIKPANLLLDKQGTIKILDMGLARLQARNASEENTVENGLSNTGNILGTVDYMSPEQAFDPRDATPTSDIYSLGCTFHYLLTGRAAYGGNSIMSRILAHREAPLPSLKVDRSDIPESVESAFRRMIAKEAKGRFQNMPEVIAALGDSRNVAKSAASHSNDETLPGDVMKAIFDD